ncbi:MAG: hypothetical protein N3F66_06410 [Spirochaetes bacterium]|nr:hypothetical protein [Spirochaetota bacterium]
MKRTVSMMIMLSIACMVAQVWAYVGIDVQKWEVNENDVIKLYVQKAPFKKYSLSQLQGYSNKLLNYILAIDENYKTKVSIVRVTGEITRDFMFIDNKLYVVTDYLQKPSMDSITGAIAQLEKKYGYPQKQSEGATTTCTFTKDDTKIIAIAENKGKIYSLTVYYYYKNLFRSLMQ